MSEQEKKLYDMISKGVKHLYEKLLDRKVALGQDMVIANANGQPRIVAASELLKEQASNYNKD